MHGFGRAARLAPLRGRKLIGRTMLTEVTMETGCGVVCDVACAPRVERNSSRLGDWGNTL